MSKRAGTRRSRWQLVLSIVLVVLVAIPVGLALLHRGQAGTDVVEPASDVWVTNESEGLVGRVNTQIHELDATLATSAGAFDVIQDRGEVYVHDDGLGTLARIDQATGLAIETVPVPLGSEIQIRGGMLAVLERASGALWVADTRERLDFDARTAQPVLELGPSAQMAVTETGEVVAAVVGDQSLYRVADLRRIPTRVPLGLELSDFEITAVGAEAVILDLAAHTVIFDDGRRTALEQNAVRLQEVSGPADTVAVATAEALLLVPFRDEHDVDTVGSGSGSGEPSSDPTGVARPVLYNDCHFGAWGALAVVVAGCPGQADLEAPIDVPLEGGGLTFRTAGNLLALNNVLTGDTLLPLQNMKLVHNWDEAAPLDRRDEALQPEPLVETPLAEVLAQRGEANRPPVLEDDLAGVRPGSSIVIPVLDNDRDPDGDVLRITEVRPAGEPVGPASGRLDIIDDGRALRFTPDPGAGGSLAYSYRVSDGRTGGVASAIVRIRIVEGDVNSPPQQLHAATVDVEVGRTATVDALRGWVDAEGDPLVLVEARGDEALDVRSTPEGLLTVTGAGEPGAHPVAIVVSDGSERREGVVTVDVVAEGTLAPETAADFATGTTGAPIVLDVLANDPGIGDGGVELTAAVEAQGREGVSFDAEAGTVALEVAQAGIYTVLYTVTAGERTATGIARFDVVDPTSLGGVAPVAVPDALHLQGMQSGSIDLIANDTGDPSRVLAVVDLHDTSQAEAAGLQVELIDHAILRVTATRPIAEPVSLRYTLSDGESTDAGVVTVTASPEIDAPRPPVTADDEVAVRAGDIAVVAPLANDTHPDRLPFRLAPELENVEFDGGIVDVDGEVVRLQAPTAAGTYTFGYRAVDTLGGSTRGTVTVTVTEPDEAANRAPQPRPVDVRAVAGTPVRVDLPLDGIDPDGDFVTVTAVPDDARLGTIAEVDATGLTFVPAADARGTETLAVTVSDGFGAAAILTLRIGVVAAAAAPVPPVAVDDHLTVPPGTPFSARVLDNDTDPRGLAIELVDDGARNDVGARVEVDGDALVVTPPEGASDFSVPYTVANASGATATAYLHVSVRGGAALEAPRAGTHVVDVDVLRSTTVVDVAVLTGATNPTGAVADLMIELVDPMLPATVGDGVLRVQAGGERLVVPYRLTSPVTGAWAVGFILVPPVPRI